MIIKMPYQQTYMAGDTHVHYVPCGTVTARFQGKDFCWTAESLEQFTKLFCAFHPYSIYEPLPLLLWLYMVRKTLAVPSDQKG